MRDSISIDPHSYLRDAEALFDGTGTWQFKENLKSVILHVKPELQPASKITVTVAISQTGTVSSEVKGGTEQFDKALVLEGTVGISGSATTSGSITYEVPVRYFTDNATVEQK